MNFCFLFFFFLFVDQLQSFEYDISNQQRCTAKPFAVSSPHNCSRTRIHSSITEPNDDSLVPITILFGKTTTTNISLIVRKSPLGRQLNLTLTSISPRTIWLNNRLAVHLNQTKILSCLYNSSNESFTLKTNLSFTLKLSLLDMCTLKDPLITPSAESTRIYFLYTDENYLEIDLNRSAIEFSPFLSGFEKCFQPKKPLTALGITLIVIVSVLSVITTVLILFWLKRQIKQMYHIWRQWFRARLGLVPEINVDDQIHMVNMNSS